MIENDILIVLAPKESPESLCAMLTDHGLTTTLVQDFQATFEYLNTHISTFLLLDLDLEGAIPFLEKVINTFYDPPPYILAVDYFPCSQSQADILNLGADTCLEKPFDLKEVLAVINAVIRRVDRLARPKPLQSAPPIEHGGLAIDPLRRHVSMDGRSVSLTVKEFDILHLLISYPDVVFSKAQIYEHVWNEDYQFSTTSVSDLISSLRKNWGSMPGITAIFRRSTVPVTASPIQNNPYKPRARRLYVRRALILSIYRLFCGTVPENDQFFSTQFPNFCGIVIKVNQADTL